MYICDPEKAQGNEVGRGHPDQQTEPIGTALQWECWHEPWGVFQEVPSFKGLGFLDFIFV